MSVLTLPFNSGSNEGAETRMLPTDRLRRVINGRLARDGQIRVRPGYTALPTSAGPVGSTLYARDLVAYNDQLLALGSYDNSPQCIAELFTYSPGSYGATAWRTLSYSSARNTPIPKITNVREIARTPDLLGGVFNWDAAASAGFVTFVYTDSGGAGRRAYAEVREASTRSLVAGFTLNGSANNYARVVALTDRAVVAYLDGTDLLNVTLAKYGTIAAFVSALEASATDGTYGISAAPGASHFVVSQHLKSGDILTRRYDADGVRVVPSGGQYANITSGTTSLDVLADEANDVITVAWTVGGACKFQCYTMSTGAAIGSPPYTLSDGNQSHVRVVAFDATRHLLVTDRSGTQQIGCYLITFATGAVATKTPIYYAAIAGTPYVSDATSLEVYVPITRSLEASTPNQILKHQLGFSSLAATPELNKDQDIAVGDFRGGFSQDPSTGKFYWANALVNSDGTWAAQLTEMDIKAIGRRQCAQLGNQLFIGGGLPVVWDGSLVTEIGFLGRPACSSLASSNAAGSLTNSGQYDYRAIWECVDCDGNLVRSAVSVISSITLGAADDTVTMNVTVPRSLRFSPPAQQLGQTVRVKLFRTIWNATDGKGAVFHLTASTPVASTDYDNQFVAMTDLSSDASLASEEIVYTQVGADSTLDHHAPPPGDYLAVGNDRVVVAGQPRRGAWSVSKPVSPAESVLFAAEGQLAFSGRISGEIEAAITSGASNIYFTRREVWMVQGQGPDANGNGSFYPAQRLLAATGMRAGGWRSVCETTAGTFFQLDDSKIYLWNGGDPVWVGFPVQDQLELYPVVVAACHLRRQRVVAFAVQASDGLSGTLLLYDLRRQLWLQDDVGVVDALAEYDGRLAYAQGGTVYLEDSTVGSGTFVPLQLLTGSMPMAPPPKGGMGSPIGTGALERVVLLGEYRGDCTVTLKVSYDDGRTYLETPSENVTSASFAVGDPVELEFVPPRGEATRVALDIALSGTTNSAGLRLNAIDVYYQGDDGPTKLGDARRR